MRISIAHPPQRRCRTPVQPMAFCGRRPVDADPLAGRPLRRCWGHPLPSDAMALVRTADAGIAHLQCARKLSEARAVVLSGDEWDREGVVLNAWE